MIDRNTWHVDPTPTGVGSRLLEIRLRESLQGLSKRFNVDSPPGGRHQEALSLLIEWNESTESIDLGNATLGRRLAEAHRLAWETFLITVAAVEDRRNRKTPFTRGKLSEMMAGPLESDRTNAPYRDIQYELHLAAMFRLCGVSTFAGEPDLRILYGQEEVGIAAKRVRSLNINQVQKHARKAASQIAETGLRGWVAVNVDSRFAGINYNQEEADLMAAFAEIFDSVSPALRRPSAKPHVLGFLLTGYLFGWHPPVSGTSEPRLHWGSPFRWQAIVDDPAEAILFRDFSEGWSARWSGRQAALTSRDFVGVL